MMISDNKRNQYVLSAIAFAKELFENRRKDSKYDCSIDNYGVNVDHCLAGNAKGGTWGGNCRWRDQASSHRVDSIHSNPEKRRLVVGVFELIPLLTQ